MYTPHILQLRRRHKHQEGGLTISPKCKHTLDSPRFKCSLWRATVPFNHHFIFLDTPTRLHLNASEFYVKVSSLTQIWGCLNPVEMRTQDPSPCFNWACWQAKQPYHLPLCIIKYPEKKKCTRPIYFSQEDVISIRRGCWISVRNANTHSTVHVSNAPSEGIRYHLITTLYFWIPQHVFIWRLLRLMSRCLH
jgi:hypothetical protein